MTRLRNCDACARHVFASEQTCPFCHAQLTAADEAAPVMVPAGASRAQRLALAAAISGSALLGCAQDTDSREAGSTQPPGGMVSPIYGAPVPGNPPPAGQAGRAAQPAAGNGSVEVPVYGAPVAGAPPSDEDAGVPEAGAAAAAGSGGTGAAGSGGTNAQAGRGPLPVGGTVAVPVYGAPIPEYGAPPPPND